MAKSSGDNRHSSTRLKRWLDMRVRAHPGEKWSNSRILCSRDIHSLRDPAALAHGIFHGLFSRPNRRWSMSFGGFTDHSYLYMRAVIPPLRCLRRPHLTCRPSPQGLSCARMMSAGRPPVHMAQNHIERSSRHFSAPELQYFSWHRDVVDTEVGFRRLVMTCSGTSIFGVRLA